MTEISLVVLPDAGGLVCTWRKERSSAPSVLFNIFREKHMKNDEGNIGRVLCVLGELVSGGVHLICNGISETENTNHFIHPLPMYTKFTKYTRAKNGIAGGKAKAIFGLFLGFFVYFMHFCEYIEVFRFHLLTQACTSVYFGEHEVHGF